MAVGAVTIVMDDAERPSRATMSFVVTGSLFDE
jgi:hypothetical protein